MIQKNNKNSKTNKINKTILVLMSMPIITVWKVIIARFNLICSSCWVNNLWRKWKICIWNNLCYGIFKNSKGSVSKVITIVIIKHFSNDIW